MKSAKLYQKLTLNRVRCTACQRYCLINDGQLGFCRTRQNLKGKLFTLIYGIINGLQIDPIEKKPLYHFYPGSQVLSFGSFGCNYRCRQCLNWHCSWGSPARKLLKSLSVPGSSRGIPIPERNINPAEIIKLAKKQKCQGIAFTYNEPSIWPEFVYQTAKLAKAEDLFTVYVTNGSWTSQALDYFGRYIDAVNIDIKGFYPQTYQKMSAFFGSILETTEMVLKKYHIFIELTTLVIPSINDSDKELKSIALWIAKKLSKDIPWHLSGFDPSLSPDEDFQALPPTPITTLKKAYRLGKQAGLNHVYVWAPAHRLTEGLFAIGDTLCPHCQKVVIKRLGWQPDFSGLRKEGNQLFCRFCHQKLNLII